MTDPKPSSPAYPVGYGKPPIHSRFQKGRSGNPRGRPKKGLPNFNEQVMAILSQKIVVREGERVRRMTRLEALALGLVNAALQQKSMALKVLLPLLSQAAGRHTATSGVLAVPAEVDLDQWLRQYTPKDEP